MEDVPIDKQIDNLFASVDMDYASMALSNRKVYLAHMAEGFTEEQSLDIVKCMLSTHLQTSLIISHQEEHPDGTA